MTEMTVTYWLTEHPSIVNFRWSPYQSWGSTWSFLITALIGYISAATALNAAIRLFLPRRVQIPLGPIPAVHSLAMAVISAVIFIGILLSAVAEIRDTRWLWRRTKTTTLQWFLCFPLGTRSSGRVFFWSYVFYLSRFLHLFRTFFSIIRRRRLILFQILSQSFLLCMSFLWLEFSQSFQVLAILLTTLSYCIGYGYRFGMAIGLPRACYRAVVNCQAFLLGCQTVCQFGVLCLHFTKGGCNGIGAWLFNSIPNAVILFLFLKFYANTPSNKAGIRVGQDGSVDEKLNCI